jgi:hypothetical protein
MRPWVSLHDRQDEWYKLVCKSHVVCSYNGREHMSVCQCAHTKASGWMLRREVVGASCV